MLGDRNPRPSRACRAKKMTSTPCAATDRERLLPQKTLVGAPLHRPRDHASTPEEGASPVASRKPF